MFAGNIFCFGYLSKGLGPLYDDLVIYKFLYIASQELCFFCLNEFTDPQQQLHSFLSNYDIESQTHIAGKWNIYNVMDWWMLFN